MIRKRETIILIILGVFFLTQNLESAWTFKRLTWNSGSSSEPIIDTDSNNYIHVVWYDYTYGNLEILYKYSTDGGSNWSGPIRLTWNSGRSYNPVIASDFNNHLHVVWFDETPGNWEILYKKSTDGGSNWSVPIRLTWNSGRSYNPVIASDFNNHLYVVWFDDTPGNWEIFYKKSTDGGSNWSGPKRLTWNSGDSSSPAIISDSNNHLHLVWCDDTPGNREIFYKKSTNSGASWSKKRLTWNSDHSYSPDITSDTNNYIHVVWFDASYGNREIFYKNSTDGGANWSLKRLTWNSGFSYYPDIASDSNNHIHVVWRDDTPGKGEIFYKTSTDSGTTWSLTRLTWNSGISYYPDIASDSNNHIHVVWHDETPGNWEIFYKKKD